MHTGYATGRFLSKEVATKLLAQVAHAPVNNDNIHAATPLVVLREFTAGTGGVPRRPRSGSLSKYAQ